MNLTVFIGVKKFLKKRLFEFIGVFSVILAYFAYLLFLSQIYTDLIIFLLSDKIKRYGSTVQVEITKKLVNLAVYKDLES